MGLQIIDDERTLVIHLTPQEAELLREEFEHLTTFAPHLASATLPAMAKALLMARLIIRNEERMKRRGA